MLFNDGLWEPNPPPGASAGVSRTFSEVSAYSVNTAKMTAQNVWNFNYGQTIFSPICGSSYEPGNSYLVDFATADDFLTGAVGRIGLRTRTSCLIFNIHPLLTAAPPGTRSLYRWRAYKSISGLYQRPKTVSVVSNRGHPECSEMRGLLPTPKSGPDTKRESIPRRVAHARTSRPTPDRLLPSTSLHFSPEQVSLGTIRFVGGGAGREQWNPTSREKRARCGAPVDRLRG